jgi:DNA-binding response OmpR family regulator
MSKQKILIAEDDYMISSMYKIKLEQDGFECFMADDGAAAVEEFNKNNPDIVILDIIMPQLDGFTVLKEIRKKNKDVPIIMLTNLGTDEDKKKGEEFGATDYLVKASLTPSQVSAAIKKYLK